MKKAMTQIHKLTTKKTLMVTAAAKRVRITKKHYNTYKKLSAKLRRQL